MFNVFLSISITMHVRCSNRTKFIVLIVITMTFIVIVVQNYLRPTVIKFDQTSNEQTQILFIKRRFNTTLSASEIHAKILNSTSLDKSRYVIYSGLNLGIVKPTRQRHHGYVILSCSVNLPDVNYAFYLPLTVLAWKRQLFASVVILVGNRNQWLHQPVLSFIVHCLLELGSIVILLPCQQRLAALVGQVSRLFASVLLPTHFADEYLLTSDVDLWPLDSRKFFLNGSKVILYQQSPYNFTSLHGDSIPMIPLSGIGMTSRMWSDVMEFPNFRPFQQQPLSSVKPILDYLVTEFGDSVLTGVTVRGGRNWFTDQHLTSVRINRWTSQHHVKNASRVHVIRREPLRDRVDRCAWPRKYTMTSSDDFLRDKVDVHLLNNGYLGNNWKRILPLLRLMYGPASAEMRWCVQYHVTFTQLLYIMPTSNKV
jgi:hypothetical protein